jgi:hypothetical protein
MEPIGNLFGDHVRASVKKPVRRSERGDLLSFFHSRINLARRGKFKPLPISAIAVKLSHCSIADLYYLKSTCLDAERRGVPFSAVFWASIKPREPGAGG